MRLNQVTLPCLDYEASCSFYEKLGLIRIVDSPPDYARFECPAGDGGHPATLSLHRVSGVAPVEAGGVYFEVERLEEVACRLAALGIHPEEGPVRQTWLWFEAWYADPAGNRICLYEAGDCRRFPPWRVDGRTG